MHSNHRQPDLSNVPFRTLRELAEAVEKYAVCLFSDGDSDLQSAYAVNLFAVSLLAFLIRPSSLPVSNHCVEVF
ncbi:hypothetical protein L208DRAFT_1393386 [Tricholoma matsutake]|nr:hypothetical protein L208DRAFT_1393386 [Tricholoma matsutake 945]